MKNFYKSLLFIAFITLIVLPFSGNAQKIKLSDGNNALNITQTDDQSIHFQNQLTSFSTLEINTKSGFFTQLNLQGYNYSTEEGAPMLPVLKRLIEVPYGATFEISFSNINSKTIQLSDYSISTPVMPVQPSVSKSDNVEDLPFIIDNDIYFTNDWYGQELARVIDLGEMRGVRMARLEIAPFIYNPVSGELRIAVSFDCVVKFKGAQTSRTETEKARVYSPWFEANFNQLINHQKPEMFTDGGDALIDVAPVTYIIVSDPMFEAPLQSFIQWKTKKGFNVVEAYTDDPAVGTTTTSIKNYLKSFYQNPPDGYHPQAFVLIVGDVAQIPAFTGTTDSHVTDLYYCEYTNDIFPECFYGRFSANNLTQLQPQIDKTLEYEQYTFPDPSFLDEVVMAAGADGTHQLTWGNGQINYGTQYYFNAAHGLYSHTYLQPEPYGGNYSANIRQNVSDGVAYANYSAHCSASGWADPSFVISHISALTNSHRYPLMVGNCCLSVKFETTCFGEEILRAPLKGAIGYIGGSNSTYWDEDFWWGVGMEAIATNPSYNSNHLGAYDRTFHDRSGITTNDWFITQGQMPSAGNLAVTQAGSPSENYYWEIYHLMGDPSLMIYFSQPPAISVSYPALMPLASETFTVNTEPYAYIAISKDGVLYGAALANASGVAEVELVPINEPGEADVVITGQNLKPFLGTVIVSTPDGPHVALQSFEIDDASGNNNGLADYGETIGLNISMENLGNTTATNVSMLLTSNNGFVTINQPAANISSINAGETVTINDAFGVSIAENIPDGEIINFNLEAGDGTYTWQSSFSITAHAPVLENTGFSINDPAGNNNGLADYGEIIGLDISIENTGNATATNVSLLLSTTNVFVTINQPAANIPSIEAEEIITINNAFEISIAENIPDGEIINFNLEAGDGTNTWQSNFSITGHAPVLEYIGFSISDPAGNNNRMLDPGETVFLSVEIKNNGSAEVYEALGELSSSNLFITINSAEPQSFGNILPEAAATANFEVSCDGSTPAGQSILFIIDVLANMGITAQGSFSIVAGQIPALIVDLDENTNSGNEILDAMNTLGVAADYTTTFPTEPELYRSLFVCLGIYNDNYALTSAEGQVLADYLNSGGNLYMEGGDTWDYDSQTAVHSMFGINGTSDGSGDMGTILGVNGTISEGMLFSYSGDNNWMDHLEAINGGTLILNNQSPAYGCGVINTQAGYKTIGVSFEFGGLDANRNDLMEEYLKFFNLIPTLSAGFIADFTNITAGESVQFTNTSSGNPISFSWTFDGGNPATSNQENQLVTYTSPGIFDVSLLISDGTTGSTITKSDFITVAGSVAAQTIPVNQGWNGISTCVIPDNTNLDVMLQQNIDDIVIMQNMTDVFYPEMEINTIGQWNYQSGYLIKANTAFDLAIFGEAPANRQIILKQGWNLMPVLSNCSASIGTLFGLHLSKVSVIKSIAGTGVFWPVYNINTIGYLQPGNAYFVYVTDEIVLTFPDCN